MLKNYLKTAFRNLRKNKAFSLINIIGLSIGMATCMLILQYVNFELSFDRFHDNHDQIYRVINYRYQNGKQIQHGPITYPTIGPTMFKDYPEIDAYTRLMPLFRINVKKDENVFPVDRSLIVDKHFLKVFSFPLLAGDRESALNKPNTAAISASLAKKHFNITNGNYQKLLGTTIQLGLQPNPFTITGVFEDIPQNSHIDFDLLYSYTTLINSTDGDADDSWQWSDFRHYLVLKPETDVNALERKFIDFSRQYFKGSEVSGSEEEFVLQPLKNTHLFSNYEYDIARVANGQTVWTLFYVALFILVIAWINYINLTTSKALERAREVGLRKVVGAYRRQLVFQFLTESLIINVTAFLLAITLVQIIQPFFNQLVDQDLSLLKLLYSDFTLISLLGVFTGIFLAGIFLSGFYPAFVLSSYRPVTILKENFQRSSTGNLIRRVLVVFQFIASAGLISGTLAVFKQLQFIQDRDLGINLDHILVIQGPGLTSFDSTFIDNANAFKEELRKHAAIKTVATSNRLPGDRLARTFNVRRPGVSGERQFAASLYNIDFDFLKTYKLNLLAGRDFRPQDHSSDFRLLNTAIVNNALIRLLGFASPEEAINQKISIFGREWSVVGVINNFHQESLHNPLEAIIFLPGYSNRNYISLKISYDDISNTVSHVESIYKKFYPGNSFDYFFLEERYNQQYQGENRFSSVLSLFTSLAIIVACMGLFGLSSFTILQRTKEIGIRKVLGAGVPSIVGILSVNFMKLIIIASLIAIPLAYFGISSWLENYTYKMNPSWWVFVLPILIILIIAFFSTSIQIFRAANGNPIKALRQE
ncbi:ABC transporter permease [Fulvivirgaceae bacterium BMA12]|uniref:ABC transporter permease n=1 Tax=Agaribacillus aureus TaxID=3051825 RepID=A0ABT8KYV2_9BACT|nr:ABC transporter permease [Fulvivirgaceae bacterium BMA12]